MVHQGGAPEGPSILMTVATSVEKGGIMHMTAPVEGVDAGRGQDPGHMTEEGTTAAAEAGLPGGGPDPCPAIEDQDPETKVVGCPLRLLQQNTAEI